MYLDIDIASRTMVYQRMPGLKKYCWFLLIAILAHSSLSAQSLLGLRKGQRKVDIPFEYQNNFIVVTVTFNKILPLKFILDTGAEHTVITKREITDILNVNYSKRYKVVGADLERELFAYLSRGNHLQLADVKLANQSIFVLEEDYLQFEEYVGENIHGIMGISLFHRFVIKINYREQVISIYDPAYFKGPGKGYEEIPVAIERNRPYIKGSIVMQADKNPVDVKLLLDTGAAPALLMHNYTHPELMLPENVIVGKLGMGMGGYVEGYLGRVQHLAIPSFDMTNIITHFQEIPAAEDTTVLNGRNGLIGNPILSRFIIILDYPRERLYLKPVSKFNRAFNYDRSGLIIFASGKDLKTFTVDTTVKNSPAELAGLQAGDKIRRINWISTKLLSLRDLTKMLQGREGKRIRMVIERNGERLKVEFRLRDLI